MAASSPSFKAFDACERVHSALASAPSAIAIGIYNDESIQHRRKTPRSQSVKPRTHPPLPPAWPFPPSRDVTGRTVGDLVALQYRGANTWVWKCRCSNHVTATLKAVESGVTRDCGCREQRRVWRSRPGSRALRGGEVFGQLTTDRYAGDSMWVCRCECGREVTVSAGRLRMGTARSCGHCVETSPA
jgi:hypothetical protein